MQAFLELFLNILHIGGMARGERLDETVPGSGLGLAICSEIAGLYGGGLSLDAAALGGLEATLDLPRAEG